MLTAVKASESPKSSASSVEQREGYCRDLNLDEEMVPGAAIIAYNNHEGQDLGEGYNNINNLPGYVDQPGEVDDRQECLTKQSLNDTLNNLLNEQKSLNRRLSSLSGKDNWREFLRDYEISIKIHEEKFNDIADVIERLYSILSTDPDLKALIQKTDEVRSGLDKLIMAKQVLLSMYIPFMNEQSHSSTPAQTIKEWAGEMLRKDDWIKAHYPEYIQIVNWIIKYSVDPDYPKGIKQTNCSFKALNKAKNKLNRQQNKLKNKLTELTKVLFSSIKNKDEKLIKYQSHKKDLQSYKQKLMKWSAKLSETFLAANACWTDKQVKDIVNANDNLWDAIEILIQETNSIGKDLEAPTQKLDQKRRFPYYQQKNTSDQRQSIQPGTHNNLDDYYLANDNHNHNRPLPPQTTTNHNQKDHFEKDDKKLRNQLTSLQQHQANLLRKKVGSKNWKKEFKKYDELIKACQKNIHAWREQLANKGIAAKQRPLWVDFEAIMQVHASSAKLGGACPAQKIADPKQSKSLLQKEKKLTQWEKDLNQKESDLQTHEAHLTQWDQALLQQQNELIQREQTLQKQEATYASQSTKLIDKESSLRAWEQNVTKQQNAQVKKENSLNTKHQQLRQWEERLQIQQTKCLQQISNLERRENELSQREAALDKKHQVPNPKKEKSHQPYVPIKHNKQLELSETYDRLDEEIAQLQKWRDKLLSIPNGANWKKQYNAYKKSLTNYKKQLALWECELNKLLNSMAPNIALKVLAKRHNAVRSTLQQLIKGNIQLGQLHQSNSNHNNSLPEAQIATQITADSLIKKHTKLHNRLESLQKCQANLLKKKVRSKKWQKKYKGYKASVHDYQKKVKRWEAEFQQHRQAYGDKPYLIKLNHKHITLQNTLQQLIKSNKPLEN